MAQSVTTNGFVPISEWPTLEDLANGFGEYLMSATAGLDGSRYSIIFEDGTDIEHSFDAEQVSWHITAGNGKGLKGRDTYKAYEVRKGLYLINFHKPSYDEYVSLVLHPESGRVLVALSGFEQKGEERRTVTHFSHTTLSSKKDAQQFQLTDELAGQRILYRYTLSDWYEHIYLNKGTFTWHCLKGTENALADTEEYKAWKLDDQCYLLFWSEKIMPVESVIVVDLQALRSTGRFFCWDPKPESQVIVEFGSHATVLNKTTYPDS